VNHSTLSIDPYANIVSMLFWDASYMGLPRRPTSHIVWMQSFANMPW